MTRKIVYRDGMMVHGHLVHYDALDYAIHKTM